jgi:hypothetical protein
MPTTFMSSVVANKSFHTTTKNTEESTIHSVVYGYCIIKSHRTDFTSISVAASAFGQALQ